MKQLCVVSSAVVVLLTAVGCSSSVDHAHTHDHSDEQSREASRAYLIENYPTRDQMLSVRQCVTERTGYEYPTELPANFGPGLLTESRPTSLEHPPDETRGVYLQCIFDLGLEDRFMPPSIQQAFGSSVENSVEEN